MIGTTIRGIGVSVIFFLSVAVAHQGATGIVKIRMDGFKQSQQDFKALIGAAHNGDYETVKTLSAALEAWGLSIKDHFPEGSNQHPTEAAETIWTDASGFVVATETYVNSVRKINEAALFEDRAAMMAAIKMTSDSCTSCHNIYRVK